MGRKLKRRTAWDRPVLISEEREAFDDLFDRSSDSGKGYAYAARADIRSRQRKRDSDTAIRLRYCGRLRCMSGRSYNGRRCNVTYLPSMRRYMGGNWHEGRRRSGPPRRMDPPMTHWPIRCRRRRKPSGWPKLLQVPETSTQSIILIVPADCCSGCARCWIAFLFAYEEAQRASPVPPQGKGIRRESHSTDYRCHLGGTVCYKPHGSFAAFHLRMFVTTRSSERSQFFFLYPSGYTP